LFDVIALIKGFLNSLSLFWEHVLLGFFENMSHLVDLFDQSWILHLPLLVILLFEKSIFFSIENFLLPLIFLVRANNQEESLLEGSSTLFSLIFELRIQGIVDHETLMDCKLTSHFCEITHSLIQV
jgi:hypothetical protein